MVHTDMASGDSTDVCDCSTQSSTCFMLRLKFHVWVMLQIKAMAFN